MPQAQFRSVVCTPPDCCWVIVDVVGRRFIGIATDTALADSGLMGVRQAPWLPVEACSMLYERMLLVADVVEGWLAFVRA